MEICVFLKIQHARLWSLNYFNTQNHIGGASGKALRYGLDGPGSIAGDGGGGDFSSLLRVLSPE